MQAIASHQSGDELKQTNAQITALYGQLADNAVEQVNAVRDSTIDPRDTLGGLKAAAQDAQDLYQNALEGGGTASPATALKARNAARQAYADAVIADANSVRDSAVSVNDPVGQAEVDATNAYATAAGDVAGSTKQKADLKIASSKYVAALQAIAQDTNSLRDSGVAVGDVVGQAEATLADTLNLAANEGNKTKKAALLKTAAQNYADVLKANADVTNSQIGLFIDPRDQVSSARGKQAQDQVTFDNTPQDDTAARNNLLAQMAADRTAVAQAVVGASSILSQLNEDITDPVVQAKQAVTDAIGKLSADRANGADQNTLNADQLGVNTAVNGEQKATFDQRLSDTQEQFNLQRESGAAYIKSLRQLRAGILGNSRQAIDERNKVDEALKSAYGSLEGQFNLGDIKIPTVYEVRRSVANAQTGQGYSDNRVTSVTINGIGSTAEVVAIVKTQLGNVATVKRAPTTTRRA